MSIEEKKVLIVEDDKPIAKALELKLAHENINATVSFGGKQALDLIEKDGYDLILLDLVMPGLDGFEVLEKMKLSKDDTPVMVLTNLSQAEDEQKCRELGVVDFFVKSDTPIAKIVDRIRELLS